MKAVETTCECMDMVEVQVWCLQCFCNVQLLFKLQNSVYWLDHTNNTLLTRESKNASYTIRKYSGEGWEIGHLQNVNAYQGRQRGQGPSKGPWSFLRHLSKGSGLLTRHRSFRMLGMSEPTQCLPGVMLVTTSLTLTLTLTHLPPSTSTYCKQSNTGGWQSLRKGLNGSSLWVVLQVWPARLAYETNMYTCSIPGHFTSIKYELGLCTSLLSLWRLFSSSGLGFNKSLASWIGEQRTNQTAGLTEHTLESSH